MSSVQQAGLEIVMVLEARDEGRRVTEAFKHAILSSDPKTFLPLLYPSMTKVEVDPEALTEEDLDEGGEWEMPEMDPMEAERLLADLAAREAIGSMTMDDVEKHEEQ